MYLFRGGVYAPAVIATSSLVQLTLTRTALTFITVVQCDFFVSVLFCLAGMFSWWRSGRVACGASSFERPSYTVAARGPPSGARRCACTPPVARKTVARTFRRQDRSACSRACVTRAADGHIAARIALTHRARGHSTRPETDTGLLLRL